MVSEIQNQQISMGEAQNPLHPGEIKVASLAKRLFHSRVIQLMALAVGIAAAVTVIALTAPVSLPVILTIAAIGIAILGVGFALSRKRIIYEVTLLYTVIRNKIDPEYRWYDQISDDIILGALPLKSKGHHEELKEYAVLSMVEDFEFDTLGLGSEPVSKEDWKRLGVPHKQIGIVDHNPVPVERLKEAVDWIDGQVAAGKKVYVHCKAGKSRSTAAAISYLAKKNNKSAVETKRDIKKIRPRIKANGRKMETIQRFLSQHLIPS